MNHTKRTALLVALPALFALAPIGEEITLKLSEGRSIERKITLTESVELDSVEMEVNGEDMSERAGDMEMQADSVLSITATDTYTKVKDGELAVLSREFDTVSRTVEGEVTAQGGNKDLGSEESSELEGLTVLFTESDGEFEATFAEDSDGDSDLLEELAADMDYSAFLPDSEVSIDDSWDIEPALLAALLIPGGNLHVDGEGSPFDNSEFGEAEGDFTATLESIEEGIAEISLRIEIEANSDTTDADAEGMEGPEGVEIELTLSESHSEYDGEGKLHWDIARGYMVSLELELDVTQTSTRELTISVADQTMEQSQTMSLTGSTVLSIECELQ